MVCAGDITHGNIHKLIYIEKNLRYATKYTLFYTTTTICIIIVSVVSKIQNKK